MQNIRIDANAMCFQIQINKYSTVEELYIDQIKRILSSYFITEETRTFCSLYIFSDSRHNTHEYRKLVHEQRSRKYSTPLNLETHAEMVYKGNTYRYNRNCPPVENDVIQALNDTGKITQIYEDVSYRAHPGWRSCIMNAISNVEDKVLLYMSTLFKTTLFRTNTKGFLNGIHLDVPLFPFCEADLSMLATTDNNCVIQSVDWDMYFGAVLKHQTITHLRFKKCFLQVDTRLHERPFDWIFLWVCMSRTDYNLMKRGDKIEHPCLRTLGYPKDLFMIAVNRAFQNGPTLVEVGKFKITFNVHHLSYYLRLLENYRDQHPITKIIEETAETLTPSQFSMYESTGELPEPHSYLNKLNCRRWLKKINTKPYSVLHHIIQRGIFSVIYYATLKDENNKYTNFPKVEIPNWDFASVEAFHDNTAPLVYVYDHKRYYRSTSEALVAYGLKFTPELSGNCLQALVDTALPEFTLFDDITTDIMQKAQNQVNSFEAPLTMNTKSRPYKDIFAEKGANVPTCNEHAFNELLLFFATLHTPYDNISYFTESTITPELIATFNTHVKTLSQNVLSIRNEHSRDFRISFFDQDTDSDMTHVYKIDRQPVTRNGVPYSVTAFKSTLFDKNRTPDFMIHHMRPSTRNNYKNSDGSCMTNDEIKCRWEKAGLASAKGTRCHFVLEAHFNGVQLENHHNYDKQLGNTGNQKLEHDIINDVANQLETMGTILYRTEWSIFYEYSDDITLCGQIDGVLIDKKGNYYIIDYKFTKDPQPNSMKFKCKDFDFMRNLPTTRHGENSFQLCTYRHILVEKYGMDIDVSNLYYFWYDLQASQLHTIKAMDCSYEVKCMFDILPEIFTHQERVKQLPYTCSHSDFKYLGRQPFEQKEDCNSKRKVVDMEENTTQSYTYDVKSKKWCKG